MTANERARLRLDAPEKRRRGRELAPASRDFSGPKAVQAAGERLGRRYGDVVKAFAKLT